MVGLKAVSRGALEGRHPQEANQARPGCLGESLQEASRAHVHVSSACPGRRSQHLHAEQVGPWRQEVRTAFQVHYLESLSSEPSFEDDVGGGPPLLRSLALASEASASAQKGGGVAG